jgi:hypothetical protein
MENKKAKPYTSRYTKFEGNIEYLDFDKYEDLVEEGFHDREIAKELNINEQFLESMKKDMYKEY